ncbi:YicC family protein [Bacteriovoracaceae bacterium]|nr:YicC family protein [Bacteriovoracaceae bacterium]
MSIQSMTGFGRGEKAGGNYTVTVEAKSVNNRFKDIRLKMSSVYNSIEIDMKKKVTDLFNRGSFDIYVNFKRAQSNSKFDDLDDQKVQEYVNKMKQMVGDENLAIQPTEFLRHEFMKEYDLSQDQELMELTLAALDDALDNLKKSRESEGSKLKAIIEKHKVAYMGYFEAIKKEIPSFQKNVEEKLLKKFSEFGKDLGIDEPRFMQEVVYFMEKLDVHEEINRIEAHTQKLEEILNMGGEVGRQLDFLVQEFNRETNTIGSKSSLKEISDSVVQMKVQLEKMREQGLNLE